MNLVDFLILGLAAMRLSRLLAHEHGPWDMLVKIRHMVGVRYDEDSEPYGTTMVASGIICEFCNSVWLGFFFTMAWLLWPEGAMIMALPWAISGLALWGKMR